MAAPHNPETNSTALSSSLLDAHTGREFAVLRFALGLSLRRVATEFGCAPDFLSRRERDVGELELRERKRWLAILRRCAGERASELARHGFEVADLQHSELGRLLAALLVR